MMTREIALEDAQLLRRAAGSQSIETLQELIEQAAWTAKELDAMSVEGKTPLQQATWKGRLHSIQYLLDVVRCDVNVYTQQKFSHGKTAIFFALTQSRKDIVEYLLSRKGINVSIVNNKGQSVMSLAASHNMPTETLQQIQALEETDKEKWWNFRVTHSDGYEYGDLDPRFFQDRPLREADVVTQYAINPTTKRMRKGGFERRNPEALKEWQRCKQQQSQSKKKKQGQPLALLVDDQRRLDNAWKVLEEHNGRAKDNQSALLTIIQLNDKLRQAWIPQATERLLQLRYDFDHVSSFFLMPADDYESRATSLLVKLLSNLKNRDKERTSATKPSKPSSSKKIDKSPRHSITTLVLDWNEFWPMLKELNISCLEHKDEPNLCLGRVPVQMIQGCSSMKSFFHNLKEQQQLLDGSLILAMDTEWYQPPVTPNDNSFPSPALSTLQLAQYHRSTQSLVIHIVDLLVEDLEFQTVAKAMIRWMIYQQPSKSDNNCLWLLGFSIGHDLAMLESFCADTEIETQRRSQILDLQIVLAQKYQFRKNQLKMYSNHPLSKEEQRSDWLKRPLSPSQVD